MRDDAEIMKKCQTVKIMANGENDGKSAVVKIIKKTTRPAKTPDSRDLFFLLNVGWLTNSNSTPHGSVEEHTTKQAKTATIFRFHIFPFDSPLFDLASLDSLSYKIPILQSVYIPCTTHFSPTCSCNSMYGFRERQCSMSLPPVC